jgi:hypothetical protein
MIANTTRTYAKVRGRVVPVAAWSDEGEPLVPSGKKLRPAADVDPDFELLVEDLEPPTGGGPS